MGGSGIATISGGKITNNTALGYGEGHSEAGGIVFRGGASKLNISGNPIIKDNAKGDVAGDPVVILDAGDSANGIDYYFVEDTTNLPAGYLNPNTDSADVQALYKGLGADYVYTTVDGQTVLAIKGTVKNMAKAGSPSSSTPNRVVFTFKNIPNTGSMIVHKTIDGKASTISGFPVVVLKPDGTQACDPVNTGKVGNTGSTDTATISGLPVFDAAGNKITYTVTEGDIATLFNNAYYQASAPQTTTLVVGQTISTVNGATGEGAVQLKIENKTYVKLDAKKVYQNTWMMMTGAGIAWPQAGAKLALYYKDTDGSWKYTGKTETSNGSGFVEFDLIEREYDYAVVELSAPENTYPYNNGTWLDFPELEQGEAPATISASEISHYNYQTVSSSTLEGLSANATYTFGQTGTGESATINPLINANHWVQFDIMKWKDKTNPNHVHHQSMSEVTASLRILTVLLQGRHGRSG